MSLWFKSWSLSQELCPSWAGCSHGYSQMLISFLTTTDLYNFAKALLFSNFHDMVVLCSSRKPLLRLRLVPSFQTVHFPKSESWGRAQEGSKFWLCIDNFKEDMSISSPILARVSTIPLYSPFCSASHCEGKYTSPIKAKLQFIVQTV